MVRTILEKDIEIREKILGVSDWTYEHVRESQQSWKENEAEYQRAWVEGEESELKNRFYTETAGTLLFCDENNPYAKRYIQAAHGQGRITGVYRSRFQCLHQAIMRSIDRANDEKRLKRQII